MFRGSMVAAALLAIAATGAAAGPPGVRFRSLEEGTDEARRTGKPALYFFTAEWCGPCHELKKNVFEVGTFARLIEGKYVPIEVVDRRREDGANAPDVEALRVRMGVTSFPTLAIQRADGNAAVRLVGFASRESSLNFLRDGDRRLREAEERERRARR
jgi:thiol:disulfide interchange protein